MDTELKSITEAAEILEVTRQWVHKLYKLGRFPNARLVGSSIAIPLSDIENLKTKQYKEGRK